MDIINFEDVYLFKNNCKILDNFNLLIKNSTFNTILFDNDEVKNNIIRILCGLEVNYSGNVTISNIKLNKRSINSIRKIVGLSSVSFTKFIFETVYEEISNKLESLKYSHKKIDSLITNIFNELDINYLKFKNPKFLSSGEKEIICFVLAVINTPDILIIDDSLSMIDSINKNKIIKYMKHLQKDGMTILNFTNESEELLLGDEVIFIKKCKVVLNNNIINAYDDITNNTFMLPFEFELLYKLKSYEILDKVVYNMKDMVDAIWK